MSAASISVVIPNYNGRKLLEQNLPGVLVALKKSGLRNEVIISDDASTDDSVVFLQKTYPFIKIIESKVNRGFATTINQGIKAASMELVFALNSDVQLTENYFLPQLRYFEDERTFGVMGRIIGIHDNTIQDGAKYPLIKGLTIKGTQNYILSKPNDKPTPSLYLSGANALMDRKKLQELGGFDEIYSPFYGEDLDLSLRAWRLGWNCYYEHESICRHPASTTIATYHKKRAVKIISTRNKLMMHSIHLEGMNYTVYRIAIFLELIFRTLTFQFYYTKAFSLFVKRKKEVFKSRESIQQLVRKHSGKKVDEVIKSLQRRIDKNAIVKF